MRNFKVYATYVVFILQHLFSVRFQRERERERGLKANFDNE